MRPATHLRRAKALIPAAKLVLRRLIIKSVRPLQRALHAADRELKAERAELQKAKFQSCGTHVNISGTSRIITPAAVAIGNNVHIGDDCFINAEGGLQIQDNVHISPRVTIFCSDHAFRDGDYIPHGPFREWRQVVIERNAWIGMNACILPGVRIGEGSIVGMGCVVAKDVPPRSIVGQPPFRMLGERDSEDYTRCEMNLAFGGRDGRSPLVEGRPKPLATGCKAEPKITFVLTTGRSGSTSIVDMFGSIPNVIARHEPRQQIIKWSTQLAHGEINNNGILAMLEELFLKTSVYEDGLCYLESDQKYFNLAPMLKQLFPRSNFIWLIRNGRDVVSSATGRGWYADEHHPHYSKIPYFFHRHRVRGDQCGTMSAVAWEAMSPFEKNCWYWSYVNSKIRADLSSLPEECWIQVRLEEIGSSSSRIIEHIGISSEKLAGAHSNTATYDVRRAKNWSEEEERVFQKLCGKEMELIYG